MMAALATWCHACHQHVTVSPDRRILPHAHEGHPCDGSGAVALGAAPRSTRPAGGRK